MKDKFPKEKKLKEIIEKQCSGKKDFKEECSKDFLEEFQQENSNQSTEENVEECSSECMEDNNEECSVESCQLQSSFSCSTYDEKMNEKMILQFFHSPMTPNNSPCYLNNQNKKSINNNLVKYPTIDVNELIENLMTHSS